MLAAAALLSCALMEQLANPAMRTPHPLAVPDGNTSAVYYLATLCRLLAGQVAGGPNKSLMLETLNP